MSERPDPPRPSVPRPRVWQLALALNAIFPPAGYAYVGAWRAATVFAAAVLLAAVALTEWTVAFPPGIYRLGLPGVIVLALCLAVGLGVHAAWMAEDAPAKSGSRLRHALTYAAASLAVLTVLQLFRAYWPHAFYAFAADSMAPTLNDGDIVAVRGARALCARAEPRSGDVALYRRDGSPAPYLHRIVAGPSQVVAMNRGQLYIDGRPVAQHGVGEQPRDFAPAAVLVRETLPNGARYLTLDDGPDGPADNVAATQAPADGWYVLGDNRDNAVDSRVHGPVERRNLCGVAFRIITSRDKSHVGAKP